MQRAPVGSLLAKGERIGLIRFGSRTDVYLPGRPRRRRAVAPGDRVVGGATVIARWLSRTRWRVCDPGDRATAQAVRLREPEDRAAGQVGQHHDGEGDLVVDERAHHREHQHPRRQPQQAGQLHVGEAGHHRQRQQHDGGHLQADRRGRRDQRAQREHGGHHRGGHAAEEPAVLRRDVEPGQPDRGAHRHQRARRHRDGRGGLAGEQRVHDHRRGDAERAHVGQGVHLGAERARDPQPAGQRAVEAVEDHAGDQAHRGEAQASPPWVARKIAVSPSTRLSERAPVDDREPDAPADRALAGQQRDVQAGGGHRAGRGRNRGADRDQAGEVGAERVGRALGAAGTTGDGGAAAPGRAAPQREPPARGQRVGGESGRALGGRPASTWRASDPPRRSRPAHRRPPGRGLSFTRRRRQGAVGT